jgi:hypothetical protein
MVLRQTSIARQAENIFELPSDALLANSRQD